MKESFWTAFGKYISLHANSEGEKINWINYHTGFKHLYFRMEANDKSTALSIQITHPDVHKRHAFFNRFKSLKRMLEDQMGEEWIWEKDTSDEFGKTIASIRISLPGVNVLKQDSWPDIISFLKPRIIRLDAFWNEVKDLFEEFR